MATFYANYPPQGVGSGSVQTVQGLGTPGAQTGGLLTIQGDPAGTPVPISGNITASSASVGPTGAPVPADADYVGMNVAGNLVGITGTASGLNTVVNAALPAGSNIIGNVRIDQTTPGTTNGVQVNAALPAGSNIIGNVRIDQTTPGTTNGVQLTAGTAIAGRVGIDQTTPGTTNGVQVNAALPAGTNIIGRFGIDQTTPGTTNAVALTAGSAIIGDVRIDQTTPGTTNGVVVNAALPAGSNSIGNIGTVTTVSAVTAITNALPAGSNIIGNIRVDQTTPGTTNGVQVTSGTTAAWQAEGNVAAGSLTNSYATVLTPSAATKIIFMRNNTNQSVSVSMDAGSTTNWILDAGDQVAIDFISNGLVAATAAIQAKYTSVAPTTGSFRINAVH